MVTEIQIIKTKGGVSRNFIFEEGEVKATASPNINQSARLSIVKDDAFDATEDFVIDLGVKKELAFEWKLYKEDNDRAEGTYTSDVKTYGEMLDYLQDIIGFPGIGLVEYEITVTDKFRTRTAIYTFEDFNIDIDSSIYPKGNMKFSWKKQVV